MLKIKNSVDLKELEKYGFIKKYYYNSYVLENENIVKKQDIVFDLKTRKLEFCNNDYDTLYQLIKADMIEVVGDE